MSAQILFGFRDMAFFWFFIFFFSKNLDLKRLIKLEILSRPVGCCQGRLKKWKFGVQCILLYSVNDFFIDVKSFIYIYLYYI